MSSTRSTDEVQSSENIQRIYIGGLDQDRLPAQQIIERLKQTQGIHVVSSDYKPSDSFMFIDVVACSNGAEDDDGLCNLGNQRKPLEIISAMYNNVRWKGCRLKVEAAKPHFLQKLANEIQQRNEVKQQEQQQPRDHLKDNKTPRYLRIRRRRGDEATKVDTKAQVIRIPHSSANYFTVPKRKKYSRALHIIFLDDDGNTSTVPKAIDNTYEVPVDQDSDNTSSPAHDDYEDDISVVSYISTTTESCISNESRQDQQQQAHGDSRKYIWSDDSKSSSTSSSSSSASDISKISNQKEKNRNHQDINVVIGNEADINLSNDVSINMDIYAQLFPDAVQTKQAKKMEHQKEEKKDPTLDKQIKGAVIPRYDPTSEFSKTFEIQKCRVSEEIISASERQKEKDVENGRNYHEMIPPDRLTMELPVFPTREQTLNNIYHEKKLESIFQEDSLKVSNGEGFRLFGNEEVQNEEKQAACLVALQGYQPTNIYQEKKLETIFQEPTLKSKNMQGFHFFGNDKSSMVNEEKLTDFCFDFSPEGKSSNIITDGASPVPPTSMTVEDLSKGYGDESNKNRRRWQGFCFPQTVLNDWEDDFFAFNGGVKKLDEENANDEWEEKRVALTLDWRRKYKQAIQKLSSHKRYKKK